MIICLGTTPTVQRTMTFRELTIDGVNRAIGVTETASGKALNVARVLHTLGESVLATGFLGGDRGRLVRRDLDAVGIVHDFVEVGPSTRQCTTVIDQTAGTATELIEESATVEAAAYDQLIQTLQRRLDDARALVMSGTLPPNAPQDFYGRCVELAKRAGVVTIVDAKAAPLRHAVAHGPTCVKINQREYLDTFDRQALEHRLLIEDGLTCGVITRGGEPALAWDGPQRWWIEVPRIEVISPIGSGDAFAAGLAAGLVRGQSFAEACRLGAACAVANSLRPVAGFVELSDVQRLLQQVRIEPA